MSQEPVGVQAESEGQATAQIVHALMRFLVTVRYRKSVVITAVLAAGLLGGLYYATATRYYEAKAKLLVMRQTIQDPGANAMGTSGGRRDGLITTLKALVTSRKVVEGAAKNLNADNCADLAGIPDENKPGVLRASLSAKNSQGEIIDVSCNLKDPNAAFVAVNAVVNSFVDFLDETNKGNTEGSIRVLTGELNRRSAELARSNQDIFQFCNTWGLEINRTGSNAHPAVQNYLALSSQLIQIRTKRAELEASLAAIRSAVERGEDPLLTMGQGATEEWVLNTAGFKASSVETQLEGSLTQDRAQLKTMNYYLGPSHPAVFEMQNKISETEAALEQLKRFQHEQFGIKLLQMVQQSLAETQQTEAWVQRELQLSQAEANRTNGLLAQLDMMSRERDRLNGMYDVLRDKISQFELQHEGQEFRIAVIEDPKVSIAPVSPSLRLTVLLSLMAGFGAGLVAVYALDILDDRFRSIDEMESQLAVSVLSLVRQLDSSQTVGATALQVHVSPDSAESESFRTLRTHLALDEREPNRIVISSAEPGDGKTTVLANLAVSYAQSKKKTLLIDADLRRPGLTAMLGMRGMDGLSKIIRGDDNIEEMAVAVIRASGVENLDVLPSGLRCSNPAELLTNARFADLLGWAESVYDQILVDSPPALATSDAAVVGRLVDGMILVVQPDKNRRRLVMRVTEGLADLKIPLLGIVVNRIGSDKDRGYYGYSGGYGYGHGYGYGYEGGYGADKDEEDETDQLVTEEQVAGPDSIEMSSWTQPEDQGGIVPRRVA